MTVAQKKLVVIDPEKVVQKEIKNPGHFVFRIEVEAKDRGRDAFLVLKSSTLNQFADTLIEESLALGNLRVVFVRMDTNADVFFDKVQELDSPELLRKLFRVTGPEQINRILHAWYDRRAESSIASAYVEHDELVVHACDLKHYRIRFADFVGLAELPKGQREHFQIDEIGNHIFWPGRDVSVDLDVVRYKVDDGFRHAKDMEALSDYKEFLGKAIRKVMSEYQITQSVLKEKGGPAERHLYRIERGEQELTSTMIDRLSNAHGLSSQEYVEKLIAACDDIVEQEAEATGNE
jgi:plasmid maintenance system antidote protein VapI